MKPMIRGNAAAVHQAGQHVHTVGIGAQPVLLVGACVTVKHIGFRHLLHAPNAGAGIVHDVILGFVAVGIGVGELGNIIVNGFFQAVAEVTADDHAGIGSGNDKAADVGNFAAALGDIAVSVQFIILAIGSKGGLPCCLGSQGGPAWHQSSARPRRPLR